MPVFAHPPEVRDRPQVAHFHRVFKDERVLGHLNRTRGASAAGRICTPERFPRQEPATGKLLKLQSRPTLYGPVLSHLPTTCSH